MASHSYQLAVDIRDQLTVAQGMCNHQPMVDSQESRSSFADRLNSALDNHQGVRKGRGRNIDLFEGIRRNPSAKASLQATHKWLSGESMPRRANMLAIAEWLGVRVEWLEYGEGDKRPGASYTVQVKEEPAGAEAKQKAEALIGLATPRSRTALERIASAAEAGRLSEEDLLLLERIAARFERDGTHDDPAPSTGSNTRLRERLRKDDSNPQQ